MITGIGIDIVTISRFQKLVERYQSKFTQKIFTARELALCEVKANKIESLAARWAAKEAFSKAIGTGWREPFRWKSIEILADDLGKPRLVLAPEIKSVFPIARIHVSLSHTAEYATAIVILE